LLVDVVNDLKTSYSYQNNGLYAHCLFKATKTKAYANLFLSSMLVEEEQLPVLIEAKRDRTRTVLSDNKERFAILGYSYYEYSKSFIEKDPYSALIFAEYGLAFSDVSGYFPPRKVFLKFSKERFSYFITFMTGFFVGVFVLLLAIYVGAKKQRKKRKKSV
jgi:hypothetical protein